MSTFFKTKQKPVDRLTEELNCQGLEWIDKRPDGGALWVIGDRWILPQIFMLRDKFQAKLTYCAEGSEETRGEPAWWTKFEDPIPYASKQDTPVALDKFDQVENPAQNGAVPANQEQAESGSLAEVSPVRQTEPHPASVRQVSDRSLKPKRAARVQPITHETKSTFYRARFKVQPKEGVSAEIWPQIIRTIHNWLEGKEERSYDRSLPSLYLDLTNDIEKYSKRFDETVRDCMFSRKLALGRFDAVGGWTRLKTVREVGLGNDNVPQYWAMEYIEQDKSFYFRRWCTDIGITAQFDNEKRPAGSYIVNVRVSTVDDPTYIGEIPPQPLRTVPNFIEEMLNIDECATLSGGIELSREPIQLTEANFDEFASRLVSESRVIPIVTIANRFDRESDTTTPSPIDIEKLAKQLKGAALVYAIDSSDTLLHKSYWGFFEEPSRYAYRAWNGKMRVYFPKIDFADTEDWRRHPYFSFDQLVDYDTDKLGNEICSALSRMYRWASGEAADIKTIETISERIKKEEIAKKYHSLLEQHAELAKQVQQVPEVDLSALHEVEELKSACEDLRGRVSALTDEVEIHKEYIDLLEQSATTSDNSDEVAELTLMLEAEMDENKQLREDAKNKQHIIDSLVKSNRASDGLSETTRMREGVLLGISSFPKTPAESLVMVEKMFPKELVFLPEAQKSARDFGGNTDDTFNALKCMALSLWSILFDDSDDTTPIEERFQSETGYELAMREGGQTNSNPAFVKLRQRNYKGKTIDITPHVKGKAAKAKYKLRIHFWADHEAKQIVIGHCGGHLPTSGSHHVK